MSIVNFGIGSKYAYNTSDKEITADEFNAILQKHTDEKSLVGNLDSIMDRGVLPTKAEYWEANCDQIYAAVLEGDFAYFAGDYFDSPNRSYALDKNGAFNLSWTRYEGSTPTSVTVTDSGIIHCVIEPIGEKAVSLSYDDKEYVEYVYTGAEYYICPIGIKFDESQLYYDCFYYRHLAKIRCSGKIGA